MSSWQYGLIRRRQGPFGTVYTCTVCKHAEYNTDKTSRAWGRIKQHVTQSHPERRLVNH